jgi:hypothetical protein
MLDEGRFVILKHFWARNRFRRHCGEAQTEIFIVYEIKNSLM